MESEEEGGSHIDHHNQAGHPTLFSPVSRSVSATISLRTSKKSVNFLLPQWRNSAHSPLGLL